MRIRVLGGLSADRRGTVSVLMAVGLTALIGAVALGVEASSWIMIRRALQNAADAATLAASMNGQSNYIAEANAVSSLYAFNNGANGVTVTSTNAASCPIGGHSCYLVTITQALPLFLAPVVGYRGNTVVDGHNRLALAATAIANQTTRYCVLALGESGAEGIRTDGAGQADLAGCNIMSNNSATCNGHNLNADIGDAHATNRNCGVVQNSNMPIVTDPYTQLARQIPKNDCTTYPQEPSKQEGSLPTSNLWHGDNFEVGTQIVCGDLQLTSNVTLGGTGSVLLVIVNGRLDLNGYRLQTASSTALTVVFTGSSSGGYTHGPTGSGTLDITSPATGPWAGVAIYQDPNLTAGVDIAAAGNTPTWDITGLVYLPHASVTFSGAVNKSSNGTSCFVLVADNILINGTGRILSHGGCTSAGLVMPLNRAKLLR